MGRILGVAVVGLGVGEQHALAYRQDGRCELRWLYDLDGSRSDEVIARLGVGRKAEAWPQILEDGAVDIVSIASFDDAHFAQVVDALRAGKHVFVEKPLCRSQAELDEVKEVWGRDPSRHLASNLVLRAAPLYAWLRQAVQNGEFGDVYAFDGDYLYGRLHKITGGWRHDVADYSVMLGGGVHLVDLMLWTLGARPTAVAVAANRISTSGTGFSANDFTSATFQFPGGLVGRITANFGCVHPHQHVVRVFGTRRTLLYDDAGPRLYDSRDPARRPELPNLAPLPASKGDLIPGFIQSVLDGNRSGAQAQHEFDVISACVAADRAAATPMTIPVEYV